MSVTPVVIFDTNAYRGPAQEDHSHGRKAMADPSREGRHPARGRRRVPAPPGRRTAQSRSGSTSTDRKSTRLNSSHVKISYAVFCLKKKNTADDKLYV